MTKKELVKIGEMMNNNFVNGSSWNYKDDFIVKAMHVKVKNINFQRFREFLVISIGRETYAPPLFTLVDNFLVEESIRKHRL